jgi:transposase
VEPNRRLGKALADLLGHGAPRTRFLAVRGAPLDNHVADRALNLCMRQRKNSLFYATAQRAYLARLLTSVSATCLQAGAHALEYLVAVPEQRREVLAQPAAWLPWHYPTALVPA